MNKSNWKYWAGLAALGLIAFFGVYFLINKIAAQFIKTLPSVASIVENYAWIISGLLALLAAFEIHKALHPRRRK
jgi:hypothetical protein